MGKRAPGGLTGKPGPPEPQPLFVPPVLTAPLAFSGLSGVTLELS